jgi:hypothetical protein
LSVASIALGDARGQGPNGATPRSAATARATDPVKERRERAQLLLLGVFHFDDPGLDAYKPRFKLDITSPARQRELERMVEQLASFRPTKIAVEIQRTEQRSLDSLFVATRGDQQWGPNEVYQLGFRMAKRLGLSRVYAVDAEGRQYMTDDEARAKIMSLGLDMEGLMKRIQSDPWTTRYQQLYARDDSLKTVRTIAEQLLQINDRERIRIGHGAYLVGAFKLGPDTEYLGPDDATSWYNRNLRIFSNLQAMTSDPTDRILVIIGAGHLPILRFLAEASPEHRLREVDEFLKPQ